MNYLENFINFFSSASQPDMANFSDLVQQELQKSKIELERKGVIMDIEPVATEETKEENEQYYIFRYKGSFIYGFKKDGVFHIVPGDLKSQSERNQNEVGEFVFWVNKMTNKIETVYESLAVNTWGIKQKIQKKRNRSNFFGIIFICFIILPTISIFFYNHFPVFLTNWLQSKDEAQEVTLVNNFIFENSSYSLTFPTDYQVDDEANDIFIKPKEVGRFPQIKLSFLPAKGNLKSKDILEKEKEILTNLCSQTNKCGEITKQETVEIDEKEALKFTIRYEGRAIDDSEGFINEYYYSIPQIKNEKEAYPLQNTNIFRFSISVNDLEKPEQQAMIFDEIMQTITFK